jgi:hypothetical protein
LDQAARALLRQAQDYGEVQLAVLIAFAILVLVFAVREGRRLEVAAPSASRRLLYASAVILAMFVMFYAGVEAIDVAAWLRLYCLRPL